MKYAFSTIACPEWDFYRDIFSAAKDFGYNGIEIRGIGGQMYAPSLSIFSADQIDTTKARLSRGGIEISCLSSGACLGTDAKAAVLEAIAYIDLANKLNVKFIRVMPSKNPQPEPIDIDSALAAYKEICAYGNKFGVMPLMETNGVFADSEILKDFLIKAGENAGALWDINHTVRFNDESPEKTVETLGKFIEYVHLKDSLMENGALIYKMPGKGDLPLKPAIAALKKANYDGYMSLEWVRHWNLSLAEPDLVIPYYIGYINGVAR